MFVIQLSDLHFPDEAAMPERCAKVVDSLVLTIRQSIRPKKEENVLIAVCGDLINKGSDKGLEQAEKVMAKLRDTLASQYKLTFAFVPGNHDLVDGSLERFQQFIAGYSDWTGDFTAHPCFHLTLEEPGDRADVVFISSVNPEERGKGKVDYDALLSLLERLDKQTPKIFVMHHTVMSMDDTDGSSILNAARLVEIIDKYRVRLLLHGHTHGLDALTVGGCGCAVIGVGALFSRDYPDVNSQFNIIRFLNGRVRRADNYTYHQDQARTPKAMRGVQLTIPACGPRHIFSGESISGVYRDLVDELHFYGKLYNVTLQGRFHFESFEQDVGQWLRGKKDFGEEYINIAKKWQRPECPHDMYFTHGQYYYNENDKKEGVDYVIEALKTKQTSSRAVLSTIDMKQIGGRGGDHFLPSLMVTQFGFRKNGDDTLMVTVYLRALEAGRFLKINICEILLLARKIRREFPFENIEITIHAFRVQIEEDFSCFFKSELDRLATDDMGKRDIQEIVRKKDYARIIELLEGKCRQTETVVVSEGVSELIGAVEWVNKNTDASGYDEKVLESLKKIANALENIRQKRTHTSIYAELKEEEKKVRACIQEAISLLKPYCEGERK